jgi:hypothetical protein
MGHFLLAALILTSKFAGKNWTLTDCHGINKNYYVQPVVTFFRTILFLRALGADVCPSAAESAVPCLMPRRPSPETTAFFDINHFEDGLSASSGGLL